MFQSEATDLVGIPLTGFHRHVYLRDRQQGTTQLVSINNSGEAANSFNNEFTLDPTGVAVAFNSNATNLDPEDTDSFSTTYFWRRDAPPESRVRAGCRAHDGEFADCEEISISCGGGAMVFKGGGSPQIVDGLNNNNLFWALPFLADDGVGEPEIEVLTRDLSDVIPTAGNHRSPSINCAGNRVVVPTQAALYPDDTVTFSWDLYVRDIVSDQLWRLTTPNGMDNLDFATSAMSSSGAWLVAELEDDLDPTDTNGRPDIYRLSLADLGAAGSLPCGLGRCGIELVSQAGGVVGNALSTEPTVSNQGTATFESTATNLHPNSVPGQLLYVEDPLGLFSDGFESGDTTRWSATTP